MSKTSPHERGGTGGGYARPGVSVPATLLRAYRAAAASAPPDAPLPPLSTLLRDAMATELRVRGVTVPEAPPAPRTAAATRARWSTKSTPPPTRDS